jgi:TonB-dependent Receptor Plug Domain
MRGLSTTQSSNQMSGGVGRSPNVAVYLDDQSVQLPGRNLDIYAADLERVELLEGPQGTLYGAGAQAGAIRSSINTEQQVLEAPKKFRITPEIAEKSYRHFCHGNQGKADTLRLIATKYLNGSRAWCTRINAMSRSGWGFSDKPASGRALNARRNKLNHHRRSAVAHRSLSNRNDPNF